MAELEDKSSRWETEDVINMKHYYIQSKHQKEQQLEFIYITKICNKSNKSSML